MTDTQTFTLTDFLLARILEEQRAVEAVLTTVQGGWAVICDGIAERVHHDVGWFVFDHGPARVLARCEADREMVEVLTIADAMDVGPERIGTADHLLRALALPYADHPDYRAEWAL